MASIPCFDEKELTVTGVSHTVFGSEIPIYSYPVTPKEAYRALYRREAVWQMIGFEQLVSFTPRVNPDNIARAFVFDGTFTAGVTNTAGGKDMFGIDWVFVPVAGGCMVMPGKPLLQDANEWYEKVVWPDIDAWDWETSAKENAEYLKTDKLVTCTFMNGWYERLISFMDFEGAIMAMIDEDQTRAVKDFFDKLSDLYIRILEKYIEAFPQIDVFCMHDDWGSQKETFFSPAVAEEMIVPYMRRVTDFLHSRDKFCDLHSCGQLFKQIPNMIKGGWDSWCGQEMNRTQEIYEKYGDNILIGVIPDFFDAQSTTEAAQRAAAKKYADQFCNPRKPSIFNFKGSAMLTPVFREELYRQSRIKYANR